MKLLYYTIELNLILWLGLVGVLWGKGADAGLAKGIAVAGFILSALAQHWAYYRLRNGENLAA